MKNKYKNMLFSELTHEYARLMKAEPTPGNDFEVMDLCEAMMEYHDDLHPSNDVLRENIKSWVGRIQRHWGLQ